MLKNFKLIKFKMAAYRPLFTSTGLILWNIIKTAQDIYTITCGVNCKVSGEDAF